MRTVMLILFAFLLVLINPVNAQNTNFETGWGDWSSDNGVWEIGVPTSGPDSAFEGNNCGATVLAGDYPANIESRLISPSFKVPAINHNPRLRFWHWFNFATYDYGNIQIRVKGSDTWTKISNDYYSSSGIWSYASVDLSAYADSTVEIAFYLYSIYGETGPGWYIDNVSIETGAIAFNNPETWETGIGDWSVDNGLWEIGKPVSPFDTAFQGSNCAGTVLSGNYTANTESRLISPIFTVPPANENPRLRFWHYFNFASYDYGNVQIRVKGSNTWTKISNDYYSNSGIWSYASVDLSAYADSTVEIAFYLYSIYGETGPGWYIDNISMVNGNFEINNPESWELGMGDWSVDNGVWEVGKPASPVGSAFMGDKCAGTILSGNYTANIESRLISPVFTVPSADKNPRLRFYNWFDFASYDYGNIQIRVKGSGTWTKLSNDYYSSSGIWSYASVDLSAYADSTVEIAFYLYSIYGETGPGWYVDYVSIETGAFKLINPETWETGIGDWSVDNGLWEVGIPISPLDSAFQGERCAGTVLNGNYTANIESRLISPVFTVPSADKNPRIRFWHWFNFASYDYGNVQVRVKGSDTWTKISNDYSSNSGVWSYASIDLSDYADSTLQLGFYIYSIYGETGPGWYIDSITFTGIPVLQPVFADFSVDDTAGFLPLTVHFTDLSTPQEIITSWKWDFDNNGTIDSEEQNPTYTYETDGVYDVKLKISNELYTDSLVKKEYIDVFYDMSVMPVNGSYTICAYPNPARDELLIKSNILNNSNFELFTSDGKLINSGKIESEVQRISMEGYKRGIYILKVINSDLVQSIKISKQ